MQQAITIKRTKFLSIEMRMLSKLLFYFVLRVIALSVCSFHREMCNVVKNSEQYSIEHKMKSLRTTFSIENISRHMVKGKCNNFFLFPGIL